MNKNVASSEEELKIAASYRMTHRVLQDTIVSYCQGKGLHVHTCPMDQRSGSMPGFPDLVIIGPGGVLWRELKVADKLNSAQRALGYTLLASKQDWAVWTPLEWRAGIVRIEIERIIE